MRIEQITFTRFVAAIVIVIFHFGRDIYPFNNDLIRPVLNSANVGVSYFFVLSGFIMVIAYNERINIKMKDYLKNRFARIYPVYFLSIILFFIVKSLFGFPIDWFGVTLNLICLQAWFPDRALSFNFPGWSLSVELLFYIMFPLLNRVYSSRDTVKKIIIPIILIFVLSQLALNWFINSSYYHGVLSEGHNFIYYFPLMHLNQFLIGNLAGLLFMGMDKKKYRNYDLLIIAVATIIVSVLRYGILGLDFHDGLLGILFIPFIILMSLNKGLISNILTKNAFVFLGEISFSIYILQAPVFICVASLLRHFGAQDKLTVFYSAFVSLIVVSAASYIFIETPLRNYIKNWR